jgi:hypothetical protein
MPLHQFSVIYNSETGTWYGTESADEGVYDAETYEKYGPEAMEKISERDAEIYAILLEALKKINEGE